MEDTLLLCQVSLGSLTLQGYRIGRQYLVVAYGVQEEGKPTRYIFEEFEDMNRLWLNLKEKSEQEAKQILAGKQEGLQARRRSFTSAAARQEGQGSRPERPAFSDNSPRRYGTGSEAANKDRPTRSFRPRGS
jgi:hypothetical protein